MDYTICVIIPSVRNHEELDIVLKGLKKQTYEGQIETVVVGPTNDPGKDICLANCLLYTSPSPRVYAASRMPSSA